MDDYITVEVTVRLKVCADANVQEVVSEMDYSFAHDQIIETEIVDVDDENFRNQKWSKA